MFVDDPLAPPPERGGGNFVFLLEDNINDAHSGASNPVTGDGAGHNVISAAKGTFADATLMTAPGGTFPSSVLACSSCHDPHGNGNFRLLYGAGVTKAGVTFAYDAPDRSTLLRRLGEHSEWYDGDFMALGPDLIAIPEQGVLVPARNLDQLAKLTGMQRSHLEEIKAERLFASDVYERRQLIEDLLKEPDERPSL